MKKFIINKKMNRDFLSKTAKDIIYPDGQKVIDGLNQYQVDYLNRYMFYTGMIQVQKKAGLKKSRWMIASKAYLQLLDKLNTILYDGTFETTITAISGETLVDIYYIRALNLLMVFNKDERMLLWNELFEKYSLITAEELEIARNECEYFDQINFGAMTWSYNEQFDYFTMKHSTPLRLENRWDNIINNPNNGEIYFVNIIPSFIHLNGKNISTPYFNKNTIETAAALYYREDLGKNIYQVGYMAHLITDRSGEGDIQLDHIDKIDYLDSLEIAVKLPKEYL